MAMETWLLYFVSFSSFSIFFMFIVLILMYVTSNPYPDLERHVTERSFINPKTGEVCLFPTLASNPVVDLSVIIPAYNEEIRLPIMMDEALGYLEKKMVQDENFKYEIIVVDDGSRDKTTKTSLTYAERYGVDKVRVLTLTRNRGKGGAIRMGVLSARGRQILFADADGATKFSELDKMQTRLADLLSSSNSEQPNLGLVCGSRAHLKDESIAKRSVFRTILMLGFHFAVWVCCVNSGLKDTQCGFKLFTRSAAKLLFPNLHVERWAFDIDLIYLAVHFKIPIAEVPVVWTEIEGSKLIPVFSWLQMAKDLLLIRLRYGLGAWKIEPKHKIQL